MSDPVNANVFAFVSNVITKSAFAYEISNEIANKKTAAVKIAFLKPRGGGAGKSSAMARSAPTTTADPTGRDGYGDRRADEISSVHGVLLKSTASQ